MASIELDSEPEEREPCALLIGNPNNLLGVAGPSRDTYIENGVVNGVFLQDVIYFYISFATIFIPNYFQSFISS